MSGENISEVQLYIKYQKKVRKIRSFYVSLMSYCIVIPILAFVNLKYFPGFYWFIFSAVGWGIGLTVQGISAFGISPFLSKSWEERKIREILEKEADK